MTVIDIRGAFPLVVGADEWFCVDLSDHPAVRAGQTLSGPTCDTDLTVSAGPTVLTSTFIGRDPDGRLVTVQAAKGVKVRLTGTAGLSDVVLFVAASGGETIGAKFQVSVE
jgi:hypothetical protein